MYGVLAIVFGQILPVGEEIKVEWARSIGFWVVGLDLFFRLPWYYISVHGQKEDEGGLWRRMVRKIFLFLEYHLLRRWEILRDHERGIPSTVVPFVLGFMIPLWLGAPLYPVMVGVIVLGFGDPAAREIGLRYGKDKVFNGGKKSKQGFWAFVGISFVAVMVSLNLDQCFPVYPADHSIQIFNALTIGVLAGGLAEIGHELVERVTESIPSKLLKGSLRLLFDDNFLVQIAVSSAILGVMAF
jgi:dolichol kinase